VCEIELHQHNINTEEGPLLHKTQKKKTDFRFTTVSLRAGPTFYTGGSGPRTAPTHSLLSHWSTVQTGLRSLYKYTTDTGFYITSKSSALKMEQIECFETSANINQTPGKHPTVSTLDTEHGESLTFRNRASYIQDRHTATLQTPHFIYFFNKYTY
jgi:hypothetical protein